MKNHYELSVDGGLKIELRRRSGPNQWAWIDDKDFVLVDSYPGFWQARWSPSAYTFYAQIRTGKNPSVFVQMHRLIMNVVQEDHLKVVVDHENHNGLDNRRTNLERVTRAVNQFRRAGAQINNKCGLRGVTKINTRKNRPWRAATYKNRSTQTIGYFDTKEEAALAAAAHNTQ